VAVLVGTCALALAAATTSYGRASEAARGAASYAVMQDSFQLDGSLYSETPSGKRRSGSTLWPFSQVLAASLELAAFPGHGIAYRGDVPEEIAALDRYLNDDGAYASGTARPSGRSRLTYFDDNEWVALDLVRAYRLLGDVSLLSRAQDLFAFVSAGWDRDTTHACPGGVFWTPDAPNADRNTVTTANGALLALELYQATSRASPRASSRSSSATCAFSTASCPIPRTGRRPSGTRTAGGAPDATR
jgi:hypothetical protein